MLLRLPAIVILCVVLAYVLFRLFTWLLNSRFLTNQIEDVVHPRAETTEDIRDDLTRARHQRDDRAQSNRDVIDQTVADNKELRNL